MRDKQRNKRGLQGFSLLLLLAVLLLAQPGGSLIYAKNSGNISEHDTESLDPNGNKTDKRVTLRVCNWEEYIDLGDWDDEEEIDLDNGVKILGENSMVEDFEKWYYETYGVKVKVEYSCFGTNEDLYNQLTIGDTFDVVCPSEYMIMKMMSEDMLLPFSDSFFDEQNPNNFYIRGLSPYIRQVFEENEINGEPWAKYAAGYMWGVTGTLYNPEQISKEEASTIELYNNPKYASRFTLKDNVRDTYFTTLGILNAKLFLDEDFTSSPNYHETLADYMNDVSPETINRSEDLLQDMVQKVYSLETDSGKADMISGKVYASYQWSGDAVYAMDQAEEDDVYLAFAVPKEVTNMFFDGWVMLQKGIGADIEKQKAAEAFVNFLSRPDNAVRNMYYIGYTSVISGGEDDTVFQYLNYNYGDEDGECFYPLGFFFTGDNADEKYVLPCDKGQLDRQLGAQYPSEDIMKRSAVMGYYDKDANARINQMWINVRCFNLEDVPAAAWVLGAAVILALLFLVGKSHWKKHSLSMQ